MKIAFLLYAKQLGGHEIMALSIARLLGSDKKNAVQVFFPVEMNENERLKREAQNVELISYRSSLGKSKKFSALSFFISLFFRFILIVRLKKSTDVLVNCQGGVEANWVVNIMAWVVRLNCICYVPFFFTPIEIGARFARVRNFFFPFLVGFPERYIVIHDFYRGLLIKNYGLQASNIFVFENRVGTDLSRKEFNNFTGRCVFVMPSRIFIKQKGHDVAILALRNVVSAEPNVLLKIVGSGPDESLVRCLIKQSNVCGACVLEGWSENIDDIFSKADCVLLPSNFEGVSLLLLEAQKACMPIIASDLPIHQQFIQKEFLFGAGDSKELGDLMLKMMYILNEGTWTFSKNYAESDQDVSQASVHDLLSFFIESVRERNSP